jgi:hypothetical protein
LTNFPRRTAKKDYLFRSKCVREEEEYRDEVKSIMVLKTAYLEPCSTERDGKLTVTGEKVNARKGEVVALMKVICLVRLSKSTEILYRLS